MGNCSGMPMKSSMLDVLRNPYFAQGYRATAKGRCSSPQFSEPRQTKEWFFELGKLVAGEALEKLGYVPRLLVMRHPVSRRDGYAVNPTIVDLAWPMLAELPNPYTRVPEPQDISLGEREFA